MTVYDFMNESPWLAFFLVLIAAQLIVNMIKMPIRHMNIRKHGWPPSHCDADGDFKIGDDKGERQ